MDNKVHSNFDMGTDTNYTTLNPSSKYSKFTTVDSVQRHVYLKGCTGVNLNCMDDSVTREYWREATDNKLRYTILCDGITIGKIKYNSTGPDGNTSVSLIFTGKCTDGIYGALNGTTADKYHSYFMNAYVENVIVPFNHYISAGNLTYLSTDSIFSECQIPYTRMKSDGAVVEEADEIPEAFINCTFFGCTFTESLANVRVYLAPSSIGTPYSLFTEAYTIAKPSDNTFSTNDENYIYGSKFLGGDMMLTEVDEYVNKIINLS